MTPLDAAETPEGAAEEREPIPLTPPPQGPDPWGVKRAENLITSLTGVLSARVVVTPLGEVSEIHVLTTNDQQAKQVVRNIESALMAQLGMKIDHRKISVAQTADVRPIEAMQEEAVRARSKQRVVVFQSLEVRPSERPQRVLVRVRLSFAGREAEAVVLGLAGGHRLRAEPPPGQPRLGGPQRAGPQLHLVTPRGEGSHEGFVPIATGAREEQDLLVGISIDAQGRGGDRERRIEGSRVVHVELDHQLGPRVRLHLRGQPRPFGLGGGQGGRPEDGPHRQQPDGRASHPTPPVDEPRGPCPPPRGLPIIGGRDVEPSCPEVL